MSLYRTWRPKSFADLVGQEAVVRTLRTALSSGKLAHAYLFSGPRGSGKTSAAKILARCIDCVNGPTPDPDNSCENCVAMLAGTALDVIEIDAASNRGIDEIRALRESAKFAPSSMRMKVFIIDEAHMLTREGANAFLKTLEEPPAHVVFILATTAPDALPPTILSRCQRYAFRRIPVDVMVERMRAIASAERIAIDDAALGAIAYRADGGLRDALTMLEQVAAYADGAVGEATVDAAFGATGRHFARTLVEAILAGDAGAALRAVDDASDAGADMNGLTRGAIGLYRNLLVARIEPGLLGSDLSRGDAAATVALATTAAQPKLVRGLRLLGDALGAARLSGNPRLELETAVLRLVASRDDPSLEALAARVATLEAAGTPAGAVAQAPAQPAPRPAIPRAAPVAEPARPATPEPPPAQAAAPATPALPTLMHVRSRWNQIRLRVEETSKPLKAPLSGATVDSVDGRAIAIGVDPVHADVLRARLDVLEAAVAAVLDVPMRVTIKARGGAPAGRASSAHRAAPVADDPRPASPDDAHGEIDLLAYARAKLGPRAETETT